MKKEERINLVILIVDDSKLNLTIAQNVLRENNIQCDILLAETGEQALDILASKPVDIVLLDIVMPGISGVEVVKKIRSEERYQNINVVMLTSLTDRNILRQCFENGANDFINKPIEPIEFISRIKAAIREVNYKSSLEKAVNTVSARNQELKEINKTLKETQFYITQKEKIVAIGELAAGVAHELNTPLGYVSSNFEVLQKNIFKIKNIFSMYKDFIEAIDGQEAVDKKLEESISSIKDKEKASHIDFVMEDMEELICESRSGIDKAAKIVAVLRNFAGSEADESFRYNDINDIIEEVMLITSNEGKEIVTFEKNLGDLPMIICSRSNIAQVLINIIFNSIYAIKNQLGSGNGIISIRTEKNEQYAICSICDNGPGIDGKIINRIFDPFFTTKDVGIGTGLGLSVAYDIVVNKHKGELMVDNVKPSGALFTIKLPL